MSEVSPCWYRVGVKAIVIKDDAVLLAKEGSSFWDFPGGGLEHDEEISAGLSREASEEINVGIAGYSKVPLYVGKSYDPVNKRPVIVLYFTVGLASEDFIFGESVTAIEFREINTLKADIFEPYIRPYFKELLDTLKQERIAHAHTQN